MEIQDVYFTANFSKRPNFYHAAQDSSRILDAVREMEDRMAKQRAEQSRRADTVDKSAQKTLEDQNVILAFDAQSYDFRDLVTMNTSWCNLDTDNIYRIESDFDIQFQFADQSICHASSVDLRHRITIMGTLPKVVKATERIKDLLPINIGFSLDQLPPSVTLDNVIEKLNDWKTADTDKSFGNVEVTLYQPKLHGPYVNDFTIDNMGLFSYVSTQGLLTSPCIRVRGRASSKDDIISAVKEVHKLVFEESLENIHVITCLNLSERIGKWFSQAPMKDSVQFMADQYDVSLGILDYEKSSMIATATWFISGNLENVVEAASHFYNFMPASLKMMSLPEAIVVPDIKENVKGTGSDVCRVLDQTHGTGIIVRVKEAIFDFDFVAALGNLPGIVAALQKCVIKESQVKDSFDWVCDNVVGEMYRETFLQMTPATAFPRGIPCIDFHSGLPWYTKHPSLIRFIPFNEITRVLNCPEEADYEYSESLGSESIMGDDDVFFSPNPSAIEVPIKQCTLHNLPLITEYEQVHLHISPRKGISQCVDETVNFWLNSPKTIARKDSLKKSTSSNNEVHVPVETLFTSIQPSLKSKSRRKAERAKQNILCSKGIFASDLESKLVFEASPSTPTSVYSISGETTPVALREVPTTAYIAKFILERVPRNCMSFNFHQYHMLSLFHGDMAAKGVVENYPFSNKSHSHALGNPMTDAEIVQCLGVHFEGDDGEL